MNQAAKIANGTFTLTWPDGKRHRTFRIRTQNKDAQFAPNKRIIALMTGADNEKSYTNFGFVDDNGIRIWGAIERNEAKACPVLWGKIRAGANADLTPALAFDRLLGYCDALWEIAVKGEKSNLYAKGYRLLAEERCVKCNRKLTNPESIRTKIGPECGLRIRGLGPIAAPPPLEPEDDFGADHGGDEDPWDKVPNNGA